MTGEYDQRIWDHAAALALLCAEVNHHIDHGLSTPDWLNRQATTIVTLAIELKCFEMMASNEAAGPGGTVFDG